MFVYRMLTETEVVYLYKVAQLRGNDENVGGERHLTEALELLIVHVHLLHGRVQRVVTVRGNHKHGGH